MTLRKAKTPAGANCGVLGNVAHHHVFNTRDVTPSLSEIQTNFITRRTRLAPAHARAVVELAFCGVAA